jgi:maltose O-acetyltransferase
MLAGDLYDASDPILAEERRQARELIHRLNVAAHGDASAYKMILADLLPNVSSDISIAPPFFCDYGYNIYAGENVF